MNCSKIQNLLSAYMDGELTGEEQLLIRRHLGECKACSEEHESLLTTKRMISCLSVHQAHSDLEQIILEALAEEEQRRTRRSPILAWWLTLPVNRRLQFAGVFAVGAVALAAARIIPVLLAPPAQPQASQLVMQTAQPPAMRRDASPVGDVIFIYNPADNAPMGSAGSKATPVSVTEFPGTGTH